MFIPCIIRHNRNDQQYAQICITALFYVSAPTCFSSSLPSSGSFWIRLSYMKIQIDLVVYHIMLVKWPVCWSVMVPSVVLPSWELRRIQKLPDDGRLLPKHVGADTYNKAVGQIPAYCWSFLLCCSQIYNNI
jgi:hypothetical protein